MQGMRYWITQYLLAAVSMFVIMAVTDLANGRSLADGVWMSLAWALAAAALFIGARYSQSRKR
ncbi:MAG: putative rane protein [Massilia sp.]|nr:putative rane protein [Massilia sp.]